MLISLGAHGALLAALSQIPITHGTSSEAKSDVDDEPFLMQLDLRATSLLAQPEPASEPAAESVPTLEPPQPEADFEALAEVEPEPTPEPISEPVAEPVPVPEPVAPPTEAAPVVTSLAEEAPVVAPERNSSEPPPAPSSAPDPGAAPAEATARSTAPAHPAAPVGTPPVASPPAPPAGGGTGAGLAGLDDGLHLRALRTDRPEYPEAARRRNEEGTVTCRLTIDGDGNVIEVEVVVSSGSKSLDAAAVRALKRWRFEPLARLTDRKRVHALQKLSFELKSGRG